MIHDRINVEVDPDSPRRLAAFIEDFCSRAGIAADLRFPFDLALEEISVNLLTHGAAADHTPRHLTAEVSLFEDRLELKILDDGPAFDPLTLPPPDVTAQLESRQVGGYGLHLLRSMMDEVEYTYSVGFNTLRLAKRVPCRAAN
jgi:serine/threonine-protein kinase RsbW